MKNKLHLIPKTVRLTCTWVATGDAKRPLTCVWGESKVSQTISSASSKPAAGRMHLCA